MTAPMPSHFLALFVALFLSWSGFAAFEQGPSPAPVGAHPAAQLAGSASMHDERTIAAGHQSPDDSSTQLQVEGGTDLPDLVQHPAHGRLPSHGAIRPAPHPMAFWRTPVLDGLRRPPRAGLATA
jgi:hypothetical protein